MLIPMVNNSPYAPEGQSRTKAIILNQQIWYIVYIKLPLN